MERGGQPGNNNPGKNKPWADALRRMMLKYDKGDIVPGEAINRLAENVWDAALAGDKDAINEIANRLDGKPKQTIDGPGEDGAHIFRRIEIELVEAGASERDE